MLRLIEGSGRERSSRLKGRVISGRVLFDGKPMPHFGIAFEQRDLRTGGWAEIREVEGRFTLRDLQPGTCQLTFAGPGTRVRVLDPITVEEGKPIDLPDIVMERGQRIAGHVRDVTGAPVVGARVRIGHGPGAGRAASELHQWFLGRHETTTDAAGAYVFEGVEVSPEFAAPRFIWATCPAHSASLIRELPGENATLDLELIASGRIDVVVEGSRGVRLSAVAQRADEPGGARREFFGHSGGSRFYDLPPGEYEVSLEVPKTVQTSPVRVTVVAYENATAKLTMVTSAVPLTVTVPPGRGTDLVLVSGDDSTPEPEESRPRIIMVEGQITINGVPTRPSTGKESVTFEHLLPGRYRASIDGQTWTSIVVAPSPEEQFVEISA